MYIETCTSQQPVYDFLLEANKPRTISDILWGKLKKLLVLPTPVSFNFHAQTDSLGSAIWNWYHSRVSGLPEGGKCMLICSAILTLVARIPPNCWFHKLNVPSLDDTLRSFYCWKLQTWCYLYAADGMDLSAFTVSYWALQKSDTW